MTVIWVILSWFVGIWTADLSGWPWQIWLSAALIACSGVIWERAQQRSYWVLIVIGAAALGGARLAWAAKPPPAGHVSHFVQTADQESIDLHLVGIVRDEPLIRDSQLIVTLATESARLQSGRSGSVEGDVRVAIPRWTAVEYGDRLTIQGRTRVVDQADQQFDYATYLRRKGIAFEMQGEVLKREPAQGNAWLRRLFQFKNHTHQRIEQLLPAPESGLLSGILLGTQNALSPQIAEEFQRTGITHIVVISGFNISIVAAICLRLFEPLTGRRAAATLAIGSVALYTILVGADPAVIRAAVMGTLYILSDRLLGRKTVAVASLMLAAFVMTIWQPMLLWDIGFQLSFVATLSLMLYADPLAKSVNRRLQRWMNRQAATNVIAVINEAVLVTVAAQILTLPLLMATFQQLSLISLIANALILPVQSAIMIWGGLATAVGLIDIYLGQILAQIAYVFLWYTIEVSTVLARVPWALVSVPFNWIHLALFYGVVSGWTAYANLPVDSRLPIKAVILEFASTGVVCGTLMIAFVWTMRWTVLQPDGDLKVIVQSSEQADSAMIWIMTPTGRQIALIHNPNPTEVEQFLGDHQPLFSPSIDLLAGVSLQPEAYGAWPAVIERHEIKTVIWPSTLSFDGQEALKQAVYSAIQDKQIQQLDWRTTDHIAVADGVFLRKIPFQGEGNSAPYSLLLSFNDMNMRLGFSERQAGAVHEHLNIELRNVKDPLDETLESQATLIANQWEILNFYFNQNAGWLSGIPR